MIFFRILLVVMIIIDLILYLVSRNKYDEYIEDIDKDEYNLKSLLPIGLYIMDSLKYQYSSDYDSKLQFKFVEIYGKDFSRYYLEIHWANKIVYMLAALTVSALMINASGTIDPTFLAVIGAVLVAVVIGPDRDITKKIEERHKRIRLDFPDFLNKFTLLLTSGMNLNNAWIATAESGDSDKPLYYELQLVALEIQSGKSDIDSFETFSKRLRMPETSKFVSILIQNRNKGGGDLVSVLRILSTEAWEARKIEAKKAGEEAATKLLIPLMIMLLAILIIMMTPAVLMLQGI